MRKKIISAALAICIIFALLPTTALAYAQYLLYVGDTLVYDSLHDWNAGTTYLWKAAETGDNAYAPTDNWDDYLFMVDFYEYGETFTLTLNGADITSCSQTNDGETVNYGIFSNADLEIKLNGGTDNSIYLHDENTSFGIFTYGTLSISEPGALTVTGNSAAVQIGICGVSGVTVEDGDITVSGVSNGIDANSGPITVSGGTVSTSASYYGMLANDSGMTFTGGTVTAASTTSALSDFGPVTVDMDYIYRTNSIAAAPPDTAYMSGSVSPFINSDEYKYVEFRGVPVVYVSGNDTDTGNVKVSGLGVSYWQNDSSGSITPSNADNYNVKYDDISQTLTLKDANITSYCIENVSKHGIYAEGDLNLLLEGSNSIGIEGDFPDYGIYCEGTLNIYSFSSGSLDITSKLTGISSYVNIMISGSGTTLNIDSGSSAEYDSRGIKAFGDVYITDAAINITNRGDSGDAITTDGDGDIRISGAADVTIVDWSTGDGKCGLHSGGDVAIGGAAQVDICSQAVGINANGSLYIGYEWNGDGYSASGSPTVKINDPESVAAITPEAPDDFIIGRFGVYTYDDVYITGGISNISSGRFGIYVINGDFMVSGSETSLTIKANIDEAYSPVYGIYVRSGDLTLTDAAVSIEKLGNYGDAVWSYGSICISGTAEVNIVDWSWNEGGDCGLHSDDAIAIGGAAQVDICSQAVGLYASDTIMIGYVQSGSGFTDFGSPIVKINDAASVAAITPDTEDDFVIGQYGVLARNGLFDMAGGTLISVGSESALISAAEPGFPSSYKYRSNTIPEEPDGGYTYGDYTYSADDKYLEITATYAITKAASENGGFTVTVGGTEAEYAVPGETVTLTADPLPGYFLSHWSVCKTGDTGTAVSVTDNTFNMPAYPVTVEAVFTAVYAITKTATQNGSFMVTVGGTEAEYAVPGETVTLTAAPLPGYFLLHWNVYQTGEPGTSVTVTGNTFSMPAYAVTVEAVFALTGGSGGYVSPNTITVTENSSSLFSGSQAPILVEADMDNAFSHSVEVKITDTDASSDSFGLGSGYDVYPFDISLYIKGTNTKTQPAEGYKVVISLPIPDSLLDNKEQISIMHRSADGTVKALASQLKQIKGVWYLVFEAAEFSPYALAASNTSTYDESEGIPYYLGPDGNKIFIGFSANGKYLAPSGVKVLVQENKKYFSDISGHWAPDNIGFVSEREIFLGTAADTFSPETGMTRAMFATVIGRLYERSFGEITVVDIRAFTDCDYDDYYGKYVEWAAENMIITGYGNGTFGPGDKITREQMAAILYRFADFLGVLPDDMDDTLNYSDAGSISGWAKNAALYLQTCGIISGRGGGSFAPQETATRAEVAAIINRFVESVLK